MDIKSRAGDINTDAVVIVATVRALKMHGGVPEKRLKEENVEALKGGMENLKKHIETIEQFGLPYIVAINKFPTDTENETNFIKTWCESREVDVALTDVWAFGGNGGIELAERLLPKTQNSPKKRQYIYDIEETLEAKIRKIAQKAYGAADIELSAKAKKQITYFEKEGWGKLPVCMAKTQYSLSDDPTLLGRPEDFTIMIRELQPSIGAGFIVVLTGEMMTMPGLPANPAALNMDMTADGRVVGLF